MNKVTTVFFLTSKFAQDNVDELVQTLSKPYQVLGDQGPQTLNVEARSAFDGNTTSVSVSDVPSDLVEKRVTDSGFEARRDEDSATHTNVYVRPGTAVRHYRV